jgi:hypothetical protein
MTYLSELWNMQWLNIIGAMLAILGIIYTGSSVLDKHYFIVRTITKSLAIGIIVASLFTVFSFVSVLLDYTIELILDFIYHVRIALPAPASSFNFSIFLPGGLIIGVVLGILYNVLREKKTRDQKSYFEQNVFLLGSVGFLLVLFSSVGIVEMSSSPSLFSPNRDALSLIFYSSADIGGCLFGIVLARMRKSSLGTFLMALLIFLLLFLVFLFFSNRRDAFYETLLEGIFHNAQLGLLIGISIDNWLQPETDSESISWERVALWLIFGGLTIPVICLFIFTLQHANNHTNFILSTLRFFLIVGIMNGQGDKLLKRIPLGTHELKHNRTMLLTVKPIAEHKQYRRGSVLVMRVLSKKDGIEQQEIACISWKRLIYGLIIGIFYTIPIILFVVVYDLTRRKLPGIVISDFSQNVDFSLLLGLTIGFIYGFGPFIVDWIDHLEERRYGQIGQYTDLCGK